MNTCRQLPKTTNRTCDTKTPQAAPHPSFHVPRICALALVKPLCTLVLQECCVISKTCGRGIFVTAPWKHARSLSSTRGMLPIRMGTMWKLSGPGEENERSSLTPGRTARRSGHMRGEARRGEQPCLRMSPPVATQGAIVSGCVHG